ncbi:hypothetical protein HMPREF1153_1498 [Selenomonas sp. CM52]|nr:hypothetical protein HMPREF1153_1498 [Selenomonas sp. CM52]
MAFLTKVVQQNISIIGIIKIKDAIISWAEFPYAIFQMFCDFAWQICSVAC